MCIRDRYMGWYKKNPNALQRILGGQQGQGQNNQIQDVQPNLLNANVVANNTPVMNAVYQDQINQAPMQYPQQVIVQNNNPMVDNVAKVQVTNDQLQGQGFQPSQEFNQPSNQQFG
eukprot:TRINITY_DN6936_c0_g2_i12.p2 TRINITY_DN6936_c0_g2~~TRINITY_DN6936_c0_g2_i12.p2  ORF type:complete len:116 (-),score=21.08 TRINITY_DN6936_c0_g2_i12:97-444(-)